MVTPMKEIEVCVRLRNNRLSRRRRELGMSQQTLADAAGMNIGTYARLENCTGSPVHRGEWIPGALKLAEFHCVPVEELFPDSILAIRQSVGLLTLDGHELPSFLSSHQQKLLANLESTHARAELSKLVENLIGELGPQEQTILRARFFDNKTLAEAGALLGVERERARQIEGKALQKLQNPNKWRRMLPFSDVYECIPNR